MAADIPWVAWQAIRCMAFEGIPELRNRIEFGGVGREFLEMEAGVGSPALLDRRPPVNRPLIPQEDDMASQVAQQPPQESRHILAVKLAGWKQTYNPRCWRLGDTVRVAKAEIRSC